MDDILRTVDSVSQTFQKGSKEEGALQLVAISLLYVQRTGKLSELRRRAARASRPWRAGEIPP